MSDSELAKPGETKEKAAPLHRIWLLAIVGQQFDSHCP